MNQNIWEMREKKTACMSAEMRIVSSISEVEGYEQLLRTWIYDA